MPIFRLSEEPVFPPPELATEEGVLAVGGDLSAERLLAGYANGIFPWYSQGDPIIWWSPDPRFVIFPNEIVVSGSMRRVLNKGKFTVTFDRAFPEVIRECSGPRKKEKGTWITRDMMEAYIELHRLGFAHSVETWAGDELKGGLYGVSLGRAFFGESMFAREDNASKTALIVLGRKLGELGFLVIDSQVHNPHVESLGAREIPRSEYLKLLKKALESGTTLKGNWGEKKEFQNITPPDGSR